MVDNRTETGRTYPVRNIRSSSYPESRPVLGSGHSHVISGDPSSGSLLKDDARLLVH